MTLSWEMPRTPPQIEKQCHKKNRTRKVEVKKKKSSWNKATTIHEGSFAHSHGEVLKYWTHIVNLSSISMAERHIMGNEGSKWYINLLMSMKMSRWKRKKTCKSWHPSNKILMLNKIYNSPEYNGIRRSFVLWVRYFLKVQLFFFSESWVVLCIPTWTAFG